MKFSKPVLPPYFRNQILHKIFTKKEKILDLACGDGATSIIIKKLSGGEVTGVDFSQYALDVAKKEGIRTIRADLEKTLPIPDTSFDTVFWGDNIEHLFNPQVTLNEIYRVLKPNGRLVLSTPNSAYWRYRLFYLVTGRIPDTEYNGKKQWDWSHIRLFDISLLQQFLQESGFSISRSWGVSGRRFDQLFTHLFPNVFGMVIVLEAYKKSRS